ncbi:hypothetical protein BGZ73_003232 [Actinomortierella ambigua]|nr:hypothetical protein BGZ73_003232 [Actinomortierella ambigua]
MKTLISLGLVATAMATTALAAIDITSARPLYTIPVAKDKARQNIHDVDMNTVFILDSDKTKTVSAPIEIRAAEHDMLYRADHYKKKKKPHKNYRRLSFKEEGKEKEKGVEEAKMNVKEKEEELKKKQKEHAMKTEELVEIENIKLMEEYLKKAKDDYSILADDDARNLYWGSGGWRRGGGWVHGGGWGGGGSGWGRGRRW